MNKYEYEKVFTDALYEILRGKIRGKVTVYVYDDVLWIKVLNGDFGYIKSIENFAERIMYGLNSQYVAYDFCKEWRKYINEQYFR